MPRKRPAKSDNIYRQWVLDGLRPHLPSDWELRDRGVRTDAVERITVFVQLDGIKRLPEAPLRRHLATFTVVIAVPDANPEDAIDSLETGVVALLHALDETRNEHGQPVLRWTGADRTVLNDRLSFDVGVELITNTTPTTTAPKE